MISDTVDFIKGYLREVKKDKLPFIAAYLSYNLLLAVFPFIIFLMSLFSILNLDYELLKVGLRSNFPEILYDFAGEIASVKSAGALTFSLLLSLNSSSAGMKAAMRGIASCYGDGEERGFIRVLLYGAGLMLAFSLGLAAAVVIYVFGGSIRAAFHDNMATRLIFGFLGYAGALLLIFAVIIVIYKLSIKEKTSYRSLAPGAAVAAAAWFLCSELFGVFIKFFSGVQRLYGSIAGVIILLYWLNIISLSLLAGAELNAFLQERGGKMNEKRSNQE